jgi:serine phosphatase RsbU (regulator of sigma subunit)
VGRPIEILVPERFRGQHVIQRRSFVAAPQTRAMASGLELAARRQDGSEFPAEISLGPVQTAEGLLIVAAVRDVTERRRAEAELQQQRAELLAAGMIQKYLLPSMPPVLPGFEIAGRMFPARTAAGDHYGYLQLPDGRLTFVVGDVSGKGVGPAVFMAAVQARLSVLAESGADVSEILARANVRLSAESDPGTFVTVFLGCLDPRTRTLVYANAGHPPGFVLDSGGQVRCTMDSTSLPLAIDPEAKFPSAGPIVLQPGDTVLLLTDGVLEAADPLDDFFGSDRTLDVLRANRHRPAGEILDALYEAVCAFTHPQRPQDDVTGVVIKVL